MSNNSDIQRYLMAAQLGRTLGDPVAAGMIRNTNRKNALEDDNTEYQRKLEMAMATHPEYGIAKTPTTQVDGMTVGDPSVVAQGQEPAAGKSNESKIALGNSGFYVDRTIAEDFKKKAFDEKLREFMQMQAVKDDKFQSSPNGIFNTTTGEVKGEARKRYHTTKDGRLFDESTGEIIGDSTSKWTETPSGRLLNTTTGEYKDQPGAAQGAEHGAPDERGRFPEFLKSLSPNDASIVSQIVDYDLPLTGRGALPAKSRERFAALAKQYDPSFNPSLYDARQAVRQAYSKGKEKQNLDAINTAIGHLGDLYDQVDGLGNMGGGVWVNRPMNAIRQGIGGNTTLGAFDTTALKAAAEVVKASTGGQGAMSENEAMHQKFSGNQSPAQIKGNIESAVRLLQKQGNTLRNGYETTMGKKFDIPFLSGEAKQSLSKMGFNPNDFEESQGEASQTQPARSQPAHEGFKPLPGGGSYKLKK